MAKPKKKIVRSMRRSPMNGIKKAVPSRSVTTEAQDLARLRQAENQQRLRKLLSGYEALQRLAGTYFREILTPPNDAAVEYMDFYPRIKELVQQLQLDQRSDTSIKLEHWPSTPKDLWDLSEKDSDATREKMLLAHHEIKRLFERCGAGVRHIPDSFDEALEQAWSVARGVARPAASKKNMSLAGKTIHYDAESLAVVIDGKSLSLRKALLQRHVARIMFGKGSAVGKIVPWPDLQATRLSDTVEGKERQNQSVRGAVRALNVNIKKTFNTDGEKLVDWDHEGNLVRRF